MNDRQLTEIGRVVMMLCLVGVIAMLGSPWFHFADQVAIQLVNCIVMVASAAVGYVFRGKQQP